MAKTYHIITFGCQMNERDSETLAGMLEADGFVKTEEKETADVVILNTCSVRENADKKFFGVLGQLKHPKEDDPTKTVCVCGCMMQQQHVIDTLKQKYPWVDLVFGTHNISDFPKLLHGVRETNEKVVEVWEDGRAIAEGLPAAREYPFKAFVNIMYGCNNFCTYCIVPYTRGRERSRRPEDILAEVKQLAASGCKEITLLGQNVNSYGKVKHGEGSYCYLEEPEGQQVDFAKLLRMVDEVEGIERIRFMTSHPKDLSDDLIEAFRDCKHLCHAFHLPVQSGSDAILKRMNRHYDRERYFERVEKLREACPDIALSTDIIVGFPGETEEDFMQTMALRFGLYVPVFRAQGHAGGGHGRSGAGSSEARALQPSGGAGPPDPGREGDRVSGQGAAGAHRRFFQDGQDHADRTHGERQDRGSAGICRPDRTDRAGTDHEGADLLLLRRGGRIAEKRITDENTDRLLFHGRQHGIRRQGDRIPAKCGSAADRAGQGLSG